MPGQSGARSPCSRLAGSAATPGGELGGEPASVPGVIPSRDIRDREAKGALFRRAFLLRVLVSTLLERGLELLGELLQVVGHVFLRIVVEQLAKLAPQQVLPCGDVATVRRSHAAGLFLVLRRHGTIEGAFRAYRSHGGSSGQTRAVSTSDIRPGALQHDNGIEWAIAPGPDGRRPEPERAYSR